MSEFKSFKKRMQESFAKLVKTQDVLFVTNVERDTLWNTYIESFDDPVEKQGHNCACCRSFIKNYANLVAIVDGKIVPIWDFECEELYQPAVKALNNLILNSTINNVFFTKDKRAGTDSNKERLESGDSVTWDHFFLELPAKFVTSSAKSIESLMGTYRDNRNVFERSLKEITVDAAETVIDLINQGSVYRGTEFKSTVVEFLKLKKQYDESPNQENFAWAYSVNLPPAISKIRGKAIGTLLIDVSEGKDLDHAVNSFGSKMEGYKRPTAIIASKREVDSAEKLIEEMGLKNSLARRFACAEDIAITNLLFVNRDSAKLAGIFAQLKEDVAVNPKSFSKIEEISIDNFIKNVLPTAKSIEVLLENSHLNNLMSVIAAKDEEAPTLFKWDNSFSWSYANAVTDSIKERVKQAGGKVDGVLRCSMQWNEDGKSNTDLDLHCIEPGDNEIYFGNCRGFDKSKMSGNLDVDMQSSNTTMVENITWHNQSLMKPGVYKFKVKNFNGRSNTGFTIQIEFNGEIFDLSYNKQLKGEVQIAEVNYDGNTFTLKSLIDSTGGNMATKTAWNLSTNKFHKVSMMMNSPNHWTNQIGNKHVFFILENAKSDESPRGFFNEFLKEELMANKRVFEVLGGKLKVDPADKELSGLGFSSTQRNHLICRIEGSFQRTIKINF